MEIRQVAYDDPDVTRLVEEVQRYYLRIYGGPDTSRVDPALFAPPGGAFYVGRLDRVPVAMGGWRLHQPGSAVLGHRAAEIKRMYVVEAARGRGLARAMLAHLEQTAIAAGADAMILETGREQPEAIALYRSAGYDDVPRFGHYAAEPEAVHLGRVLAVRA
ncbi:MAG: GNAT family N-acetyltransferase [Nocardioidaceae bacterium]